MKVYVSGPMSGLPDSNFPAFNAAAAALRSAGFIVVNPAELNPIDATAPAADAPEADHKAYWQKCLRVDIRELSYCDAIVTLPGWYRSKGAHLEVNTAHHLGIRHFESLDELIVGSQSFLAPGSTGGSQ